MFKEFRDFAMRGNVLDMAVGIIIGVAFGRVIDSMVKDLIMPPVGMLLGKVDFANLFVVLHAGDTPGPYLTVEAAQKAGAVTLNYGLFTNHVVSFVLVAFAVYLLVRSLNKLRRQQEEAPKEVPPPPEDVVLLREIRDALTRAK